MDTEHETLELIRRRLEHEDNLVNHRLSWILMSQSFLLSGYAILLNGPIDLRSAMHIRNYTLLMRLIPWIGLVTVLLIWLAIFGALVAMRDLRSCAVVQRSPDSTHIQGRGVTRWLGMAAPILIPAVFFVTWLLIILW